MRGEQPGRTRCRGPTVGRRGANTTLVGTLALELGDAAASLCRLIALALLRCQREKIGIIVEDQIADRVRNAPRLDDMDVDVLRVAAIGTRAVRCVCATR